MAQGILLSAENEIDFMIHGVFKYNFFGNEVWITTTHMCMLIVLLVLIIFGVFARRAMLKATEVPTGFQNVVELIVEKLDGMVDATMGKNGKNFRNYIGTIFIFILISNISGLFGLRPPTADYGVTLPLGLMTFTLIHVNKFRYQKVSGVIKGLCDPWPFWAPINMIGDIAVPVSLSLRLFANVLSGTVIMALIYGLLQIVAIGWPGILHVYFDLFSGAIQTYVFCMLTMTYIANACGGDVRSALNGLEIGAITTPMNKDGEVVITKEILAECLQKKATTLNEDVYYDLLSCFCKSLRGSDSTAALYYANRLIEGGIEPQVIARRTLAHAAEEEFAFVQSNKYRNCA